MHVCLFTIPKPTACPGHGRPGNTSPPALLLRCGGRRGHTTRRTGKPLRRRGKEMRERKPPTVGTTPTPPTHPPGQSVLVDHNLGPPRSSFRRPCLHASSQMAHSPSLPEMGTPTSLQTPSIYTTLPTGTRGASSKPQTDPRHCHLRQTGPSRVAETCSRVNAPSWPLGDPGLRHHLPLGLGLPGPPSPSNFATLPPSGRAPERTSAPVVGLQAAAAPCATVH